MLAKLTELAAQQDGNSRRDLLRAISDMFYSHDRDHLAESEVRLFADVVTRVLSDLAEDHRAAYSAVVSADERTPREVALALASDSAYVAEPVIRHSPALTDDDLISIAEAKGMEHRLAISKRENVAERVTDVLIDFAETEVMISLLDNQTARTSEAGLQKLADMAANVEELREKLSLRRDLPEAILRQIMPLLSEEAQHHALDLLGDEEKVQRLVKEAGIAVAVGRADNARRRLEIKGMAQRVLSGDLGVEPFLDKLVARHRPLDLALGLSIIATLPERQMANVVISVNPEPLAVLCKSLNVGVDTYRLIEQARRESIKIGTEVPKSLLDQYAGITPEVAQRAYRFVKVRANVSAA